MNFPTKYHSFCLYCTVSIERYWTNFDQVSQQRASGGRGLSPAAPPRKHPLVKATSLFGEARATGYRNNLLILLGSNSNTRRQALEGGASWADPPAAISWGLYNGRPRRGVTSGFRETGLGVTIGLPGIRRAGELYMTFERVMLDVIRVL